MLLFSAVMPSPRQWIPGDAPLVFAASGNVFLEVLGPFHGAQVSVEYVASVRIEDAAQVTTWSVLQVYSAPFEHRQLLLTGLIRIVPSLATENTRLTATLSSRAYAGEPVISSSDEAIANNAAAIQATSESVAANEAKLDALEAAVEALETRPSGVAEIFTDASLSGAGTEEDALRIEASIRQTIASSVTEIAALRETAGALATSAAQASADITAVEAGEANNSRGVSALQAATVDLVTYATNDLPTWTDAGDTTNAGIKLQGNLGTTDVASGWSGTIPRPNDGWPTAGRFVFVRVHNNQTLSAYQIVVHDRADNDDLVLSSNSFHLQSTDDDYTYYAAFLDAGQVGVIGQDVGSFVLQTTSDPTHSGKTEFQGNVRELDPLYKVGNTEIIPAEKLPVSELTDATEVRMLRDFFNTGPDVPVAVPILSSNPTCLAPYYGLHFLYVLVGSDDGPTESTTGVSFYLRAHSSDRTGFEERRFVASLFRDNEFRPPVFIATASIAPHASSRVHIGYKVSSDKIDVEVYEFSEGGVLEYLRHIPSAAFTVPMNPDHVRGAIDTDTTLLLLNGETSEVWGHHLVPAPNTGASLAPAWKAPLPLSPSATPVVAAPPHTFFGLFWLGKANGHIAIVRDYDGVEDQEIYTYSVDRATGLTNQGVGDEGYYAGSSGVEALDACSFGSPTADPVKLPHDILVSIRKHKGNLYLSEDYNFYTALPDFRVSTNLLPQPALAPMPEAQVYFPTATEQTAYVARNAGYTLYRLSNSVHYERVDSLHISAGVHLYGKGSGGVNSSGYNINLDDPRDDTIYTLPVIDSEVISRALRLVAEPIPNLRLSDAVAADFMDRTPGITLSVPLRYQDSPSLFTGSRKPTLGNTRRYTLQTHLIFVVNSRGRMTHLYVQQQGYNGQDFPSAGPFPMVEINTIKANYKLGSTRLAGRRITRS